MANFLDYIDWRGDLPFRRDPFNEVDNLILSELAYAELGGIVPEAAGESVTLREAARRYEEEGRDQSHMANDPGPLLRRAAESERFGTASLSAFADETDEQEQLQFAALTIELDDGSVFVSFRGTDNTIVGWREDFNLCVLSETPGQRLAAAYLDTAAERHTGLLRVGGHSKGGNLAFYAAAFCGSAVKSRIAAVYSNDGPGFRREITERALYREISPKLVKIVPEGTVIGLLLTAGETPNVIKSSVDGPQQHSPYTWLVEGKSFIRAKGLSTVSQLLDEALDRWMDTLNDTQRANLVSAIFDSLEATGAVTLAELNANKRVSYNAVLRAVRGLDPALRRDVLETMKKLALSGKDVLWNEAKSSFDSLIGGSV